MPIDKNTKVEFHNNHVGSCIPKSESGFFIGLNPGSKYQQYNGTDNPSKTQNIKNNLLKIFIFLLFM